MNRREFVMGNLTGLVVGAGAGLGASRVLGAPPPAPPDPTTSKARTSYAQNGEDLFLRQALVDVLHVEKPDYIDVGAWDPIIGSNTYLLYQLGGRGVLVEPNPTFCEKLRAARPGDTVVNAGVGVIEETETDYFIIAGDGQLNTFSREQVEKLKRHDANIVKQVVKMPLRNINKVLEQNFKAAPALFSVDCEGMDLTILKTLDFDTWRPKVFCVESALENAMVNEDIVALMKSKGYIFRGGNFVNSMFVDRHLFNP